MKFKALLCGLKFKKNRPDFHRGIAVGVILAFIMAAGFVHFGSILGAVIPGFIVWAMFALEFRYSTPTNMGLSLLGGVLVFVSMHYVGSIRVISSVFWGVASFGILFCISELHRIYQERYSQSTHNTSPHKTE